MWVKDLIVHQHLRALAIYSWRFCLFLFYRDYVFGFCCSLYHRDCGRHRWGIGVHYHYGRSDPLQKLEVRARIGLLVVEGELQGHPDQGAEEGRSGGSQRGARQMQFQGNCPPRRCRSYSRGNALLVPGVSSYCSLPSSLPEQLAVRWTEIVRGTLSPLALRSPRRPLLK